MAAAMLSLWPLAAVASPTSTTVSFRLIDNRVFVPVTVNGKGPFSFILDTGAPDFGMSTAVMHRLRIKALTSTRIGGAGEGTDLAYTLNANVELGGLPFPRQSFFAQDFSRLDAVIGFTGFDGVAGKPVFAGHVAELDFARSQLTLASPGGFIVPQGAIVIPFVFYNGFIPEIDGRVTGLAGRYVVDLGDRSSLTLFGPFWRAHHLDRAFAPTVTALTGFGIGGPVHGEVVRVPEFTLGNAIVKSVVARLSLQKSGVFADPSLAGSIGTGILKRFRVTFDYQRHRIILVREPALDVADTYDRAGMWLGRYDNEFRVIDTVASGPAEEAGLRKGDVVTAVDGTPAAGVDLFALRVQLSAPATRSVSLAFRRGATATTATLRLRNLVPG